MKQKIIITFSILLLLAVVYFMTKDLFQNKGNRSVNPYEYKLDNLKQIDPKLIHYQEVMQFASGMDEPHAIAVDQDDKLYVAGKQKLIIFNLNGDKQNSIDLDTTVYCITVGIDKNIYLGFQDKVEVWNQAGEQLRSWIIESDKPYLTSIAVLDESVFVADAGEKVVYHFNKEGIFQNDIGRKDTLNGIPGFIIPSPYFDLLIGIHNDLWVVNPGLHSFESYTKDGKLISSWERTSMQLEGFSGCCNPSNIAMLSDGSFVTSEKGLERIKIHEPSGEFRSVVAGPESFDEGTKGLDLAVDSKDYIYVLDPERNQIRIFEKK